MMERVCCAMDVQTFKSGGELKIREFTFASSCSLVHFQVNPELPKKDRGANRTNFFASRVIHGLSFEPTTFLHTHSTIIPGIRQLYDASKIGDRNLVLIKNDQLDQMLKSMDIPTVTYENRVPASWTCSAHALPDKGHYRCSLHKVTSLLEFIPEPSIAETTSWKKEPILQPQPMNVG